jgi:nucleoredoxin
MKTTMSILLVFFCAALARGEFRTWTRADGKTAELELLSVGEKEGEKAGMFKTRAGDKAIIKSSALSEADAKLLAEWKPPAVGGASEFDGSLNGNLLQLKDNRLQPVLGFKRPTKYYVFYYTASWCYPCQEYTPKLVEFYSKNKNDSFEIVLVTSDDNIRSIESYAKSKKMSWPHLRLQAVKGFKKAFDHGVTGIPSVITCSLDGKIVSREESIPELEKLLK